MELWSSSILFEFLGFVPQGARRLASLLPNIVGRQTCHRFSKVSQGRLASSQRHSLLTCCSSNSTTAMGGETKDTMTSSNEYPKLVARPVGKKVRA